MDGVSVSSLHANRLFVTSRFLSLVFVFEGARAVLPLAQETLYSIGIRSLLPTGIEHNMYTIMQAQPLT